MTCFSYDDIYVYHFWFALFFPGVFFHSRVSGASPVTETDWTAYATEETKPIYKSEEEKSMNKEKNTNEGSRKAVITSDNTTVVDWL